MRKNLTEDLMKKYWISNLLALTISLSFSCGKKGKDCPDCPIVSPMATPTATQVYPYTGKWGTSGNGNGQFNQPFGIAAYNGYIYVVDALNARVEIFDSSGNYVSQFAGSNGVTLSIPNDICIANGTIYITDANSTSAEVKMFDLNGNGIGSWGTYGPGGGPGQFSTPAGITLDKNNLVYIADFQNNRLQRCNSDGTGCVTFGNGKAYGGVAVDNNLNLYAAVYQSVGQVEVYNSSLVYKGLFSTPPSGSMSFACGIDMDSGGNLLVVDQNNKRVVKFNSSGNYLTEFGNNGSVTLVKPNRITSDSSGNVYVTDNIENVFYKFAPF
jgi:tripartite motif-containing protein 71